MKSRTLGGANLWSAVAAAAGMLLSVATASAQSPATAPAGAAAPAGQAPGPEAAAPGSTPGATPAGQDPFTVKNLIGDAVSLSNQTYPEVESAIQRFKNSDVVGAREYLEQAKQKYPKLPPVDLLLAKLMVFSRNGEQGRALLEQTVTNQPTDPEAYLLLADLAFAEGRTTEAQALFEKARGLVDAFTDNEKRKQAFQIRVLAGTSAVHERRMQWNEALALLTQWAQIDPDSAAAHTRLGITQFRLKKADAALAEFRKARELEPTSGHPHVMLGQLYTQDKNIEEARRAFEQAYKEDGKNEATARAYAEWLIQQNELDKAQQVATAMRQNAPNSEAALMLEGLVAKMRNQPEAAEAALTKVLGINPSNAGATNLLALILSESTNPAQQEKALRYAQMNAERFGNNAQANITLAWILSKLNRASESDQFLTRAIQAGNLNADSAYLVARILVAKNQKENAARALEQVLTQTGAGMFMYRKDAEALLKELGGTVPTPATTPATTPTSTPAATQGAAATPPAQGAAGQPPRTPAAAAPTARAGQ
jgi:tetratricopeptide (TPR) repeat protein